MKAFPKLLVAMSALLAACSGSGVDGAPPGEEAPLTGCECGLDWQIDNLAVCVVRQTGFTQASVYSSHLDTNGIQHCDPARTAPQPVPADAWSANRVKSACAGTGTLCIALKQGMMDADGGVSSSCTLLEHCSEIDYTTPNEPLELPPLAAWSVADANCANSYDQGAGFYEFNLTSDAFSCGAKNPTLINRRPACPPGCDLEPAGTPRCAVCDLCPADCAEGSTEERCINCGGTGSGAVASF
ncbi:MAG: hypothetical protein QM778_35520 [Myxococcales bacterium]